MEKSISGHIQVLKMNCSLLSEFTLPNNLNRAEKHSDNMSKMLFIHLGLNHVQHSYTPVLQHSGIL
jgi:hypothetical protein